MFSSLITARKFQMGLMLGLGLLSFAGTAFADYYFEILNVGGVATQKTAEESEKQPLVQGNILTPNTWIEVENGGFVDLALDREWQNTIRFGERTKVFLTALFPTGFYLEHGDLFAKLDELPKDSTLEIQTPVAVAAVRGTTFRVLHRGQTKIENYSASTVFVFGITSFRSMYGEPVQVADNQTTDISNIGTQPAPPRPMTEKELKAGLDLSSGIRRSIEQSDSSGRVGTIQTVEEVTRQYTQDLDRRVKAYMAELSDRQRREKNAGVAKEKVDLERFGQKNAWEDKDRKNDGFDSNDPSRNRGGSGSTGFSPPGGGSGSKPEGVKGGGSGEEPPDGEMTRP